MVVPLISRATGEFRPVGHGPKKAGTTRDRKHLVVVV